MNDKGENRKNKINLQDFNKDVYDIRGNSAEGIFSPDNIFFFTILTLSVAHTT